MNQSDNIQKSQSNDKKKPKKLSIWKTPYQKEKDNYLDKLDHFLDSLIEHLRAGGDYQSLNSKKKSNQLISQFDPPLKQQSNQPDRAKLNNCISDSMNFLISLREEDSYWNARLDSNIGLNAQYILLKFFLGLDKDPENDQKIINYIINNQSEDGSWSIYKGGPGHLSYSITAYFALKLYGYSVEEPMMKKAREFILNNGGITEANVETKFWLAVLDQYTWEGLPPIPVQIILAPKNFTFSIYNLSYWCRTSLVPMSVLYNKKITVKPPKHAYIDELYLESVDKNKIRFDGKPSKLLGWENLLLQMTKVAKVLEKLSPEILDKIALKKARDWILSHQDDSGDWGGIYPAMQYSIMALKVLGYDNDSSEIAKGLQALERFQIKTEDEIMLSACTSPVWDTAWAVYALRTLGYPEDDPVIKKASDWLWNQQIYREGDWCIRNPQGLPGAWCFQFYNDFYPDTDDSATVLMALLPGVDNNDKKEAFKMGVNWLLSMQNDDGGWGAFERNVDNEIMNYLPINDIKNFLDQSTVDVTGRILELLGQVNFTMADPVVKRAVDYIKSEQEEFGAWFGRWGVNYIYGTWSVLRGLENIGEDMNQPYIQSAVQWLKSCQNVDGGWGESCHSYEDITHAGVGKSTASQTAWSIMALISADEAECEEVRMGINYFISTQNNEGGWDEEEYTGTGFERAFYLRYYYYPYYFPMLAIGNYCRMT